MSSSLRRSTCDDTPLAAVFTSLSALRFGFASPRLDVVHPSCSWSASWSCALNLAFQGLLEESVLSFNMSSVAAGTGGAPPAPVAVGAQPQTPLVGAHTPVPTPTQPQVLMGPSNR